MKYGEKNKNTNETHINLKRKYIMECDRWIQILFDEMMKL